MSSIATEHYALTAFTPGTGARVPYNMYLGNGVKGAPANAVQTVPGGNQFWTDPGMTGPFEHP